jgi:L,D-peptidoglycan transpeptidase YkuD (ErfK/YbiS/YcfS/YnhG family)
MPPPLLCAAIAITRFRRTGRRQMQRASVAAALLHRHLEDQVGVAGKQMVGREGSTTTPWWPARG